MVGQCLRQVRVRSGVNERMGHPVLKGDGSNAFKSYDA